MLAIITFLDAISTVYMAFMYITVLLSIQSYEFQMTILFLQMSKLKLSLRVCDLPEITQDSNSKSHPEGSCSVF